VKMSVSDTNVVFADGSNKSARTLYRRCSSGTVVYR